MTQAKTGDTVKVHFTGTLSDGTQFASSRGHEPLAITLGEGRVISGLESAVAGMTVGATKTVTVPAAQAYGPRHDHLAQEIPRAVIPDDIELAPGLVLNAQGPEGQAVSFTVVAFDDDTVAIDGNHPLAGEDLTFVLELMEVA